MPAGMCLRSNWGASHIADSGHELTLDAYCRENGNHMPRPIPLERFIAYGRWYQSQGVQHLENRQVQTVEIDPRGFRVTLADGEQFSSSRVVVATGIGSFVARPVEFDKIPSELASHSSEHSDLRKFAGRQVVVIGAGQSALESAALLKEAETSVEVIARDRDLNWVGLHPRLHHLGIISRMLYSNRDVGPAGISRLVAMPHLFQKLPRGFQERTAYRAIRPAGAGWLRPRLTGVPIVLGRKVVLATVAGSRLQLKLTMVRNELSITHFWQQDFVLMSRAIRSYLSRYWIVCKLQTGIPSSRLVWRVRYRGFTLLANLPRGVSDLCSDLFRGQSLPRQN